MGASTPTAKQLEDAFQAFNQLSRELSGSYSDLQNQVVKLTAELNRARDEKLTELLERERLAERLDKMLQALPAGVLVLDAREKILDANRQAREMLGTGLIGGNWSETSLSAFVHGGNELRLKDGRWISISTNHLDNDGGKIVLLTDISETRRLQHLLNQHQRLTALGEMSARLAHQVRTPLSTLLLYLPQLENESLEQGKRKELVSRMRDCLHHMEQTTLNMLAYARRDHERREPIVLREVIDSLLDTMANELERREAALEIFQEAGDISVMGNRDAFLGALVNLLDNALEACETQPKLKLKVWCSEGGIVAVDLLDNGVGIPETAIGHVFEPFFTTRSSGTGLGLAVAKAVIHGMGGTIGLQSAPGEGTRVRIRIPTRESQPALPAQMLPREISPESGKAIPVLEVPVTMENMA
ncbi:sensor histidine kinase [Thiolapillus brandeum]|nr:ATP-binding protein [Thiolapillus brandeum]